MDNLILIGTTAFVLGFICTGIVKLVRSISPYLAGKHSYAPAWWYKLPPFFQCAFNGTDGFDWLGRTWHTSIKPPLGTTLFMAWRIERALK